MIDTPRVLTFERAPDLRVVFAKAVLPSRRRGRTLPAVAARRSAVRVDASHVSRFARFCGFVLRDHLPLSYPHLLAFPLQMAVMARPDFPFALVGLVHTENVIDVSRPIRVEEPLDITVRAQDLRPHRRGRVVDLLSEIGVGGEPVWRSVSTYLARGRGDENAATAPAPSVEDLKAGPPTSVWTLPDSTGRRFAAIGGDWNPIHVHRLTAKPLGFSSCIVHGMYTYSRALGELGDAVPERGRSAVWFRKPMLLPATPQFRAAADRMRAMVLEPGSDREHLVLQNTAAD